MSIRYRIRGAIAALALTLTVSGTSGLGAQTGTVTGTITDANSGQPIIDASVGVVGTGVGGTTDPAGRYLLSGVPTGEYTIRVRAVGYVGLARQVTVMEESAQVADFRLEVSALDLDEVVGMGPGGTVERRRIGTSLRALTGARIAETGPADDFSRLLEGRIPGVRSSGTSGGIGAGRLLLIRGVDSFDFTDQRPVVYVDGVRVDTEKEEWGNMTGVTCCFFSGGAGEDRLSDLNPEEIDRVQVLKGPAAAALYGAEASAGVIEVFTKRGRKNSPPSFTLQTGVGFHRLRANLPTRLRPGFTGPDGFRAWDPNETLIENGLVNNYDVTATGGWEELTYFGAGGLTYQEGSVRPNDQLRGNVRLNLDWTAAENLSLGVTSAYARNSIGSLQSGNNWHGVYTNAMLSDPRKATREEPYGGGLGVSVADAQAVETASTTDRWTGRIRIGHDLLPGLRQQVTIGLDRVEDRKTRRLPADRHYFLLGEEGEVNSGDRTSRKITAGYRVTYDYDRLWGLDSFTGSLTAGLQGYWDEVSMEMHTRRPETGACTGRCTPLSADTASDLSTRGLFAINRFDVTENLFVTLAVRADAHSAFASNHSIEVYPKADFAYSVPASRLLPALSTFRVRGAFGTAGKPPPRRDGVWTVVGDSGEDTDPYIRPENKREIEAGLDIGLWNDRAGLELTYYDARTVNALGTARRRLDSGSWLLETGNCCGIRNHGIEAAVAATLMQRSSFGWNTNFAYEWNRNRIVDLGPNAVPDSIPIYRQRDDGTWVFDHWRRTRRLGDVYEGESLGEFEEFGIAGYDPATNSHIRTEHLFKQGAVRPTHLASVFNSFRIGNHLRLSFQLRGEVGAVMMNLGRSEGVFRFAHDEVLEHLASDGSETRQSDSVIDRHRAAYAVDKRDHLRLQQAALTYSLPDEVSGMLGLQRTTVTLSGYNLHWWDNCNCPDPSREFSASDFITSPFMALPQPRRFLLSVRTRF